MVLCMCTVQNKKIETHIFALDTVIDVTLYAANPHAAQKALDSLETIINHLDTLLSISAANSDVYRINHRTDSVVIMHGPVLEIMHTCRDEWKLSGGMFDVTVAPLKYLYGLEAHQESHQCADT